MSHAFAPRVRARVVDLRRTPPKEGQRFLVDTNVWYWTTYTKASQATRRPHEYQQRHYPHYLMRVLDAGGLLLHAATLLLELLSVIEAAEADLYFTANRPTSPELASRKGFRHAFPEQRKVVIDEVAAAWGQIESMSELQAMALDGAAMANLVAEMSLQEADAIDALLLRIARAEGVPLITDDMDLATGEGVVVYTANGRLLDEARGCGRLGS